MVDCNDCVLRKGMAKFIDIHWLGAEDCPLECPFNSEVNSEKPMREKTAESAEIETTDGKRKRYFKLSPMGYKFATQKTDSNALDALQEKGEDDEID